MIYFFPYIKLHLLSIASTGVLFTSTNRHDAFATRSAV